MMSGVPHHGGTLDAEAIRCVLTLEYRRSLADTGALIGQTSRSRRPTKLLQLRDGGMVEHPLISASIMSKIAEGIDALSDVKTGRAFMKMDDPPAGAVARRSEGRRTQTEALITAMDARRPRGGMPLVIGVDRTLGAAARGPRSCR
jgi:thymidine phosphorylase